MTVDKNHFISLLHRYSGSSVEEAEKLLSLQAAYPYSQLLHTLAARVSKDHGFENHQEALQLAAIHAADRSVLKEIIETPYQQNGNTDKSISETSTVKENLTYSIKSVDSVDVADEVIKDLEKLNTLRHNFEMMFVEYSEVNTVSTNINLPRPEEPAEAEKPVALSEAHQPITQKTFPPKKKAARQNDKSKKERIIELAKAMEAENTMKKTSTPQAKKKGKNTHQPDELIEEIQSSKQEIPPGSPKQKEQIALINQFIKTQPSITSAKDRQATPTGDLTPVKSGEFGDNIVSETLVEILIKQGKKDKAIEVLKKLIWKYPQKKAYFASQIEDLKK